MDLYKPADPFSLKVKKLMEAKNQEKVQNQLSLFLKRYRRRNSLTAQEAARTLDMEIASYRKLEGKRLSNRVISSFSYLEKIASLNDMSLSAFVTYLERNGRTESGTNEMKRELWIWEKKLLEKFDFVGIPLRERFLKGLDKLKDKELAEMLACLVNMSGMNKAKRKALCRFIEEMSHE